MKKILSSIKALKKTRKKEIDFKLREFKKAGRKSEDEIFNELCFCILTANYSAEKGIMIQNKIGNGFRCLSEKELAKKLKELGHRFPNKRADYIICARKHRKGLKDKLASFEDEKKLRVWLVKNVKGLGYKEAGHFLRNIGFENLAIIDFHIIDSLVDAGLIEKPKTITLKKYLEIENVLKKIAGKAGMNLAELDLYLWCNETGKVLK